MTLSYCFFATSFGELCVVGGRFGVKRLFLPGLSRTEVVEAIMKYYPDAVSGSLSEFHWIVSQLRAYFDCELKEFRVKLDLRDLSLFKRKVYKVVKEIPYGEHQTYEWVAKRLGDKKLARAVGRALASNPLPLFIPCHRVIRKDGSLAGFSAPLGVNFKFLLLKLESGCKL